MPFEVSFFTLEKIGVSAGSIDAVNDVGELFALTDRVLGVKTAIFLLLRATCPLEIQQRHQPFQRFQNAFSLVAEND
jgi:hypothetical protein